MIFLVELLYLEVWCPMKLKIKLQIIQVVCKNVKITSVLSDGSEGNYYAFLERNRTVVSFQRCDFQKLIWVAELILNQSFLEGLMRLWFTLYLLGLVIMCSKYVYNIKLFQEITKNSVYFSFVFDIQKLWSFANDHH